MPDKFIILPESEDIQAHLALEEMLLDSLPDNCYYLLLYRSNRSVVIGKNQNPWLEANLPYLAEHDITLARRLSGGGTVYHDLNNLNYSFICHESDYDRTACGELIIEALARLGITAHIGERHILCYKDRKISGTAFCIRRSKVIHHGTLLISTDLDMLQECLKPSCKGIETKGIRSIPSPVINLCEVKGDLVHDKVCEAIIACFGGSEQPCPEIPEELLQQYRNESWIYNRTPRFSCQLKSGDYPFEADVKSGQVEKINWLKKTHPEWQAEMPFKDFLTLFPDLLIHD